MRGLEAVRAAAERALRQAGALPKTWRVRRAERLSPTGVLLDVGGERGLGFLLEWHERHPGAEPHAVLRGPHHAAGYRDGPGAWPLDRPDCPEKIRRAATRMMRALVRPPESVRLGAGGESASDGEGGPSRGAAPVPVPLTVEAFRARADALIGEAPLVDGWRLADVFAFGPESLALTFHRGETGGEGAAEAGTGDGDERVRLRVRPRDDQRAAAHRTALLDVLYGLPLGRSRDAARERTMRALASDVAMRLDALDDGPPFAARATPDRGGRGGAGSAEPPPPALNLALPAPCGQRCAFCSIFEEVEPILDPTDAYVVNLRRDVAAAGARGTKLLRVNGLEPLAAPYLFELLDLARASGFDTFHILSTMLPLADRAFAERFFEALPARYRFYVPIYGSRAEVHDALTGRPGSFDLLTRALENIDALLDPARGDVTFPTIILKGNGQDLMALGERIAATGHFWELHMPFPNTSSPRDRYRAIAMRSTDILEACYPPGTRAHVDIALGEVPLCVALRHQVRTGHRLLTVERLSRRRRELAGTFYETAGITHSMGEGEPIAFTSATTPCPHVDGCALASVCPGKVYEAYADAYGLDELAPVAREAVLGLRRGAAIMRYVRQEAGVQARPAVE